MSLNFTHAVWSWLLRHHSDDTCAEWRDSFNAFYADMGERPRQLPSLRRTDPSRPFERGNCYWAPDPLKVKKPAPNRLKAAEVPLLLEMLEGGISVNDVAKTFGVTAGAIRNLLARRKLRIRDLCIRPERRRPGAKITAEDAKAIREQYGNGASVADLRKAYGISLRSVYNVLSERTWR